jgi:hypothetical protein
LRARRGEPSEELREAHVVTDGEPELAGGRIDHCNLATRRDVRGLAIGLGLAGDVYVEQMNLVVARDAPAAVIEHE